MPRDWRVWAAGLAAFLGALLVARRLSEGGGGGGGATIPGVDPATPPPPVDPYAAHTPAGEFDPPAKPGVKAFRAWALEQWGERPKSPENISRWEKVDKPSDHHAGRAWDLMTTSIEHGDQIIAMLLAPEEGTGEPDALARRAGISYIIWNKRMWRAYPWQGEPSGTWTPYTGENPHTDHLHISFGWPGANGETSLYQLLEGVPAAVAGAPYRLPARPWQA